MADFVEDKWFGNLIGRESWHLIIDNDALITNPPAEAAMQGTNAFKWDNQVGEGDPEIYFKGCIHAQAQTAGPTGLAGNLAAGKVNVLMRRNPTQISYNTFAINLVPEAGDTFDLMFPAHSFVAVNPSHNKLNADQIRRWDGVGWVSYFKSTDGQSWKLVHVPDEQARAIFAGGYMIRLQPANPPDVPEEFYITTVGKVLPIMYQSDIGYGTDPLGPLVGTKYTSFGNPYPNLATFDDAFSQNMAAGELTKLPGLNKLKADQIRYWDAASNGWRSCYLASDNAWKLVEDDSPAFGLMIGMGFMFRKADQSNKGAFIWKYLK